MIKRLYLVALFFLMISTAAPAGASSVLSPVAQPAVCNGGLANFFGFQPWYACLPTQCANEKSDGTPKLCSLTDVYKIIFPIVDWIIKGAVLVSAGMIFFMLFKIATSRGNSSQYSTAISGIRDAIIGLVLAVLSVAILNFVSGAFY